MSKISDIDKGLPKEEKKRLVQQIIQENLKTKGMTEAEAKSFVQGEASLEVLVGDMMAAFTTFCYKQNQEKADYLMGFLKDYCEQNNETKKLGEIYNLYEQSFGKKYELRKNS